MAIQNNDHMKSGIELHDATVSQIDVRDNRISFAIGVCVHRSTGTPGLDAGTCWWGNAVIEMRQSQLVGVLPVPPIGVADGSLVVGNVTYSNVVPVPLNYVGKVEMWLLFDDSIEISIRAEQLDVWLDGELQYVEDFP